MTKKGLSLHLHDFSTMGMKYKDEEDKCYGIAGMAIGIAVCNGEDMLYRLDIDDETNGYITFTSDYYYSGNPALPAKESWELTLKHFQMTIGMLMANMMCRSLHKKRLTFHDAKKSLFKTVEEEGKRVCQLEEDEISRLFEDTFNYMERVFDDGSVRTMAKGLATKLHELRTLTNPEIKEILGMIKG